MVFHISLLLPLLILVNTHTTLSCYKAIFSFGDSLNDNGNYLYIDANDPVGNFPYGSTYFHHPTGRYSDGRIILDFIATEFGLPMLKPYFSAAASGDSFRYGANFAVGGATAVDTSYFREKGFEISWTEYSLGAQIREFKQLLALMSSSGSDSTEILSQSLVFVGEMGGNDYFQFIEQNRIAEMKAMVPNVISVISSAVNTTIELGARVLVVPGITALGCTAFLLTLLQNREDYYDPQTGCIKWVNEFVEYHNARLRDELDFVRSRNPNVTIIYADYYAMVLKLYQSPQKYGFEESLVACCGGEGPYNTDISIKCGEENASVLCSDPSVYICWDGSHYTESAYKIMARGILEGPYAVPSLKQTCSLASAY